MEIMSFRFIMQPLFYGNKISSLHVLSSFTKSTDGSKLHVAAMYFFDPPLFPFFCFWLPRCDELSSQKHKKWLLESACFFGQECLSSILSFLLWNISLHVRENALFYTEVPYCFMAQFYSASRGGLRDLELKVLGTPLGAFSTLQD